MVFTIAPISNYGINRSRRTGLANCPMSYLVMVLQDCVNDQMTPKCCRWNLTKSDIFKIRNLIAASLKLLWP